MTSIPPPFQRLTPLILGSFFLTAPFLQAEPPTLSWKAEWSELEVQTLPHDVEISAANGPEAFASAFSTAASIVENPTPGGDSTHVLGLRDASEGKDLLSASVSKGGFSALKAKLSFQFYTRSSHRNGSLLVRLLNTEGKSLAAFQLYSKENALGEIQLNTFAPEGDRSEPKVKNLYTDKSWTPVTLDYDGAALLWSLQIGGREFSSLPVDATVIDQRVERIEIHTGFGAASKTLVYLDQLSFETISP